MLLRNECRYARRLLAAGEDLELSQRDRLCLVRHLAACPGCRQVSEEYRVAAAFLDGYRRQSPADDRADWSAFRAAVDQDSHHADRLRWALPSRTAGPQPAREGGQTARSARQPEGSASGSRPSVVARRWAAAAACAAVLLATYVGAHLTRSHPASLAGSDPRKLALAPPPTPSNHPVRPASAQADARPLGATQPRTFVRRPPWRGHVATPRPPFRAPAPTSKTKIREPEIMRPARPADDMAYVNGDSVPALFRWAGVSENTAEALQARIDREARRGDDFVAVPFPRIAGLERRALVAALDSYRRQKEIVDSRLTRRVTLAAKATAFSDLCRQLSDTSGIDLQAARSVADEKATIFCQNTPLRDLMRQITHVFGYRWARTGEDGRYAYELTQDLRAQLAEQELCNQDLNAALVDMEAQLAANPPKPGTESAAAAALVRELSPSDLMALRSGQKLSFSGWSTDPSHRLSPDLNSAVVQAFPRLHGPEGVFNDRPGVNGMITLHIDRSELGQLSLSADVGIHQVMPDGYVGAGYSGEHTLATGRSPSVSKPGNARQDAALRRDPALAKTVSLHPRHVCPRTRGKHADAADPGPMPSFATDSFIPMDRYQRGITTTPHVQSADVWEEVHRQTGLPVVADSYMKLYPAAELQADNAPLFDALCRIGDTMGVHWKMEDGFLQARSVSFFWDKQKEVPNRLLERWRHDSDANQGLPLDDVLEMASLSDEQLDSKVIGDAMVACWGLEEWDALHRPIGYYSPRPFARLLAGCPPPLRAKFFEPEGAALSALPPEQQRQLLDLLAKDRGPWAPREGRFRVDYVPSGWYSWVPHYPGDRQLAENRKPVVAAKTPEEALAEARKLDPDAKPDQIKRSGGIFAVTNFNQKGEAFLVQGIRPQRFTR